MTKVLIFLIAFTAVAVAQNFTWNHTGTHGNQTHRPVAPLPAFSASRSHSNVTINRNFSAPSINHKFNATFNGSATKNWTSTNFTHPTFPVMPVRPVAPINLTANNSKHLYNRTIANFTTNATQHHRNTNFSINGNVTLNATLHFNTKNGTKVSHISAVFRNTSVTTRNASNTTYVFNTSASRVYAPQPPSMNHTSYTYNHSANYSNNSTKNATQYVFNATKPLANPAHFISNYSYGAKQPNYTNQSSRVYTPNFTRAWTNATTRNASQFVFNTTKPTNYSRFSYNFSINTSASKAKIPSFNFTNVTKAITNPFNSSIGSTVTKLKNQTGDLFNKVLNTTTSVFKNFTRAINSSAPAPVKNVFDNIENFFANATNNRANTSNNRGSSRKGNPQIGRNTFTTQPGVSFGIIPYLWKIGKVVLIVFAVIACFVFRRKIRRQSHLHHVQIQGQQHYPHHQIPNYPTQATVSGSQVDAFGQPQEFYQDNSSIASDAHMKFAPQNGGYYPAYTQNHYHPNTMQAQPLPQAHPQFYVYPTQQPQPQPGYYMPNMQPVVGVPVQQFDLEQQYRGY